MTSVKENNEKKAIIISYYYHYHDKNIRTGSPAAGTVINYMAEVLNDLGYQVEIISPSWIVDAKEKGIYAAQKEEITPGCVLKKTPSIAAEGRVINLLNKIISRIWIMKVFFFSVQKEDTVFVYHEPTLMLPVSIFKKTHEHRICMIAEELYSDIPKFSKMNRNKEIRYLQSFPDAYVFPTVLLNDTINKDNEKPYIIVHGTYHAEKEYRSDRETEKIHVVYAGTLNRTKGGAAAVAAAEYLTEKYHIHIIGFGTEEEKEDMIARIEHVKAKTKCSVSFDGVKLGEEYTMFIQKCDIGLSVQNPDASYNETSFPSKVLSYLSNGLRVVSIRIKALETSAVNELMSYYDHQNPKEIAQAIMKIKLDERYDSRSVIKRLNDETHESIKTVLEGLQYDRSRAKKNKRRR